MKLFTSPASFAILVALVWGWVLNVIALVSDHAIMPMAEFILRIVGLFVPIIGSIIGFFV